MADPKDNVRACIFDIFGTTVDWRTSVSREMAAFAKEKGIAGIDAVKFADEWRAMYQPSMEEVRSGRRPWTILDVLHKESLAALIGRHRIAGLSEAEIDHLSRAWHRLDPWPDVVEGLTRLKKKMIIAPCSNGNIALMVNMAKRAGLPWDCILGAETARAYKPLPEAYLAVVPPPRPRAGAGDDGCGAQRRPESGQGAGARHRLRAASDRARAGAEDGPGGGQERGRYRRVQFRRPGGQARLLRAFFAADTAAAQF